MVENKGWLRIVEASVAILIIFSVLILINSRQNFTQGDDLTRIITPLLEEIARNVTLREKIVEEGEASQPLLENFVESRIPQSTLKYEVVVCSVDEICSMPTYPQDAESIYASERVISSTIDNYNPQKVKIFLWRAQT